MSNQLIPEFTRFLNDNGEAEAGLLLYTYIAGTTTDKDTYQTYAGTANANPVVLDSAGYPPAGLYGSGSYKFVLKDSSGATLRSQDNIVLTSGLQSDANGDYTMANDLTVTGDIVAANVLSGTYTPTITDVTNIDSSTPAVMQWSRVGDVVTVSGLLSVDTTAASLAKLRMSLPVASNFTSSTNCAGGGQAYNTDFQCCVYGDTTNDEAIIESALMATINTNYAIHFTYVIL